MLIAVCIIAAIVAVVLLLASMKPDTFRFDRRITVNAPPDAVFPLINDFHNWPLWSPWEKLDPAMQRTWSGATSGVGAHYSWSGNRKAGRGSMEITSATAPTHVQIKLDFVAPFEAHNNTAFRLADAGGTTTVAWEMSGRRPFMIKVMTVFMNMDDLVGKDFERGLAALKAVAEK